VWNVETEVFKTDLLTQGLLRRTPEFIQELLAGMGARYGMKDAADPLEKGVDYFLEKNDID
jgi:hypothetical protein